MSKRKNEALGVTSHGDHEVIMPPNKLIKAVGLGTTAMDDPVARAEQALAQLSGEFSTWMNTECERLDAARLAVAKSGFIAKTREDLFHAAHDIKGQAATFGFPSAGDAADSLCRLIEHSPDLDRIPMALIHQHVDAVRAIIREHNSDAAADVAAALAQRLRDVSDDFLRRANAHRPEYLDGILGPPLAPTDDGF
jgi:HPt (histidine-containing phosphotransfer) domain-containing protein